MPELAALEKLLYLDCDLLFNRDIDLLWQQDLTGYEYAAARDHYGKFLIQPNYINAGVLLFHMPEALRTGLFAKARDWLRRKNWSLPIRARSSAPPRAKNAAAEIQRPEIPAQSTIIRHFAKRLYWLPYPHTDNIKQWQVERVRRVFGYPAFDDVSTNFKTERISLTRTGAYKRMNELIPIFFAADDAFVKYTLVALTSLKANADPNRRYQIYILQTRVSERYREAFESLEGRNFRIEFVDVSAYLDRYGDALHVRDYYSRTTYYRLFIAEMYPKYNKAIYIDSDTIVLGNIAEMYDHDLGDNYVAAAPEQAMRQTDVFGTYVEKVLGIDRMYYFNAGVLLINCALFRRDKILEKFTKLLGTYTFRVTQDEDYLNVLCEGRVSWLSPAWNTEVYGTLPVPEEEMKIIHYIMVSKPWHFPDCRLKDYFWHYAKMTPVYGKIRAELKAYTDLERAEDLASGDRLAALAAEESEKRIPISA